MTERSCPECGESILAAARKCRFCGVYLDPALAARRAEERGLLPLADLHQGLRVAAVLQLAVVGVVVLLSVGDGGSMASMWLLVAAGLIVLPVSAVVTYLTGRRLMSPPRALLWASLALVPGVSLVVLMWIDHLANERLLRHGSTLGVWGADLDEVRKHLRHRG